MISQADLIRLNLQRQREGLPKLTMDEARNGTLNPVVVTDTPAESDGEFEDYIPFEGTTSKPKLGGTD